MQRLFEFVPSNVKPDVEFFNSEQCNIIRKLSPRGYFVATDEKLEKVSAYIPQRYCRMYWTIKDPTTIKAFDGRIRCIKPVDKWPAK